jgi:hypothetical protein
VENRPFGVGSGISVKDDKTDFHIGNTKAPKDDEDLDDGKKTIFGAPDPEDDL